MNGKDTELWSPKITTALHITLEKKCVNAYSSGCCILYTHTTLELGAWHQEQKILNRSCWVSSFIEQVKKY